MDRELSEKSPEYENDFDARKYLDTFYALDPEAPEIDKESQFLLKFIEHLVASGYLQGESLIEIGSGPSIHHILPASNSFKKIYLTDYNQGNLNEIEKWLQGKEDAFDWSPYMKYVCDLEGNSTTPEEKAEKIKKCVSVLKSDVTKANPLEPNSLPPADCVIIAGCLICACKTVEDFKSGLKNTVSLMRSGGYLTLIDYMGASYYVVGKEKFPLLSINEDLVKQAIIEAGCVIEEFTMFKDFDFTEEVFDCKKIFCILARKL
ncbi:nicotinamide N-methyltransferase-like [Pelobates fuscus]|uniref:nicotinamide N-methyltransferase-like n=1 Tax=Pelobates fuscus TaxID=191477 RepID=UPI002FE4CD56